jgi:hypothetical protein
MSSAECPGVAISRIPGASSNPSAGREIQRSPRYQAQWSCRRALGKSATFSVWSGWWCEMTTSVTSSGATPSAESGSRIAARPGTSPGSITTATSASRAKLTVDATLSSSL